MKPWEVDWSAEAARSEEAKPWEVDWSQPEAPPPEGGFMSSVKQTAGSVIKGAGQAAADFIPGVSQDNAVKRYGQEVIDANPTAVRSLRDIADKPGTAVAEAAGNAGASIGGMLGARALGMGITAAAPLTGPLAPATALVGQAVAWLGPAAIAALPSFGGIRDKQIFNDPAMQDDWRAKTAATLGAAAVGAIESKFGPQNWALSAMTKEGRAALAEKFAETTLAKGVGYGALKGAAVEGAEELVQNPIEQVAAFENPTTRENLEDTAFSGAMGAIGGGVFGGAAGALSPRQKAQQPKEEPAAPTLGLPYNPDPFVSFPDGTVGRREDVERYIAGLPEDQRVAARAKLAGLAPQKADPVESILSAPDADTAIRNFVDGVQTSIAGTGADALLAPANDFMGAVRGREADVAADAADLADFRASEERNLQVARAQAQQEQQRQAELDALQATGTGQYGIPIEAKPAVQQAATLEAPTAMQLAMQKAREKAETPPPRPSEMLASDVAPAAPAAPAPSVPPNTSASAAPARSPDILPTDIARKDGTPFQTASGARYNQRFAGGVDASDVVPVQGGFVVRPKPQPSTPDATTQPQAATTSATPDAGAAALPAAPAVQPAAGGADLAAGNAQPGDGALKPVDQRLVPVSKRTPAAQALAGPKIDAEWTAFAPESGTRGVPRADMPQIKAEARGALTQFLGARGITHESVEMPAADLKPTQAEFSPAKVAKAKAYEGGERSILVSSDGHILDGHHQWAAALEDGRPVKAIRLDAPIEKLLAEVKEFPSAQAAAGATKPKDQRLVPVSKREGPTAQSDTRSSQPRSPRESDQPPRELAELGGKAAQTTPQPSSPGRDQAPQKTIQPSPDATPDPRLVPVSKRPKGGRNLRSDAYDKNPLMTFLARNGLYHVKGDPKSLLAEFSPDKHILVQGHGPIFRRNGAQDLDQLAAIAEQDGYLPPGSDGRDLAELIQRAIRGERIAPLYAEGVAEAEMEARMRALDDLAALPDNDRDTFDDDMFEGTPMSEQDAMRAMGFTEQEIADELATAQGAGAPQEDRQGPAQPDGATAEGQGGGAAGGSRPAGEEGPNDGLTAPTPEELRARAETTRAAAVAEAQEQKRLADKAKADAERDEFALTGSDRPADVAAAGGQQDIFAAPPAAQATAILDAANVTGKDRLDILKDVKSGALTPDEVQAAYPEAKAKDRLTDAGEELIRNRRGKLKGLAWDDVSAMNDTLKVAQVIKSNVWPRPDYAKMVEAGAPAWKAAALKAVYDKIATAPVTRAAPTDADLKAYIETLQQIREALTAELDRAAADGGAVDLWRTLKAGNVFGKVFPIPADAKPLYGSPSPFDRNSAKGKENNRRALLVGGNGAIQALQFNNKMLSRVKDLLADGFPAKMEAWQKSYEVRQNETRDNDVPEGERTGEPQQRFYVYEKGSRWRLAKGGQDGGYATQEQAEAFARTLVAKKKEVLPPSRGLDLADAARTGPDWRKGKDATAQDIIDRFGFRGVNLGEYVKAKQGVAQLHLNHVFDAFSDLADLLGVPPKAMSLNGTLGVAVGAQGSGKALAHFVPGVNEINITRDSGAGALAHEFGHAMDHYFATQHGRASSMAKRPYLSAVVEGTRDAGGVRPEVMDAMRAVMKTINSRTMTEEEVRKYMADQRALNQRRLDRWVAEFKGNRGADPAALDAVAEKLKRGDIGEHQETDVETNLAEFMRAAGLKPGNSLAANAFTAAYRLNDLADEARFMATHIPQVDTNYTKASAAMDAKKTGDGYWNTPWEKFARAFETFAMDALKDRQRESLYLSGLVDSQSWRDWAAETGKDIPYPAGAERLAMQQAFQKLVDTIQTREDDAGNVAMFSRADDARPSIAPAALRRFVEDVTSGGIPGVNIADTVADLPAVGQKRIQSEGMQGVRGMFDKATGQVWLVRENIGDEAEAQFVLLHEAFHRGLVPVLGDGVKPVLNRIYLTNKSVREQADRLAKELKIGRMEAIEEVLADMAGEGKARDLTGWDRLVALIRQFVEKLGFELTFTDDMVEDLVAAVRREGLKGGVHVDAGRDTTAAVANQQDVAGNQTGRPAGDITEDDTLELFHGSPESGLTEVDDRARSLFGGVFASTSARSAHSHGDSLYSAKIPRASVLTQHDLDQELPIDLVDAALRRVMFWLDDADYDDAYRAVIEDRADRLDNDDLIRIFRQEDAGEASWEAQRIRGQVARTLGYKAVEMSDEHGTSYLLLPGVKLTPNESPAPDGGGARYSRSRIVGATSRQHTPEQLRAMKNVGFQVEVPTLEERARALWKDAGKKLAQGIVDQFAPVKALDGTAYGLLRLAKGASGAFEAFLHGGKLKLSDNVYDFDETERGGVVEKLLMPLQGEHHDFMRWIAANRAERLKGEDKERLFSDQDIADLKTLASGTTPFDYTVQTGPAAGRVTRDRTLIYADSLRIFNQFNKNILDMAEQSGLIDGASRKLWENEFYVPFYRVADDSDGGIRGANIKGGVVRQQAFKALKGGKNALNADLLDNTLMNWAHLLDAAAKNRAAKATIEAAERMGVAAPGNQSTLAQMASSINNKNGVVWFMDGGQKRYSLIDDPYIMTALTSLEYAGMRNPVMNAMGAFKHALTVGVTASPFFKIRNLIRDSVQVLGTSSINPNPLANVAQGWALTDPKSDAYFRLLAGGGTIHFGTMMEGSEAKRVQALVESGVDDATILNNQGKVKRFYRRYIEPGISAYNELGNRGEAINRASLYDQLVKQGMSHAEASLQARDLMDFSMQGSFTTIRFLTQVVPFLNARLQGLYKLGRGAKEDPARFSAVVGAAAVMSVALLAAYGDDDEWKKREEWDRNNFWWFKFGGMAFRIPKPFEIGAIATLAERGFELAFDDEMTSTRFRKQVMTLLGDNLSMNPVPQLVKPILDIYANKDSFSGRPIETMSMERLKAEYRFNDRTSMTARAASAGLNAVTGLVGAESLSPVQIDHMLRGYFGWLGAFVVGAGDVIARPLTDQPKHATPDYWKVATGGIVSGLRDAPSRYVSQMYDQAQAIEKAYGTWRQLRKEGKAEEAQEFAEDNRDKIAKYQLIQRAKRNAAKLNERVRMIERSNMDADQKRDLITTIRQQQNAQAKALAL